MELDVITVLIVPEKKGLFLKHSEYEVSEAITLYTLIIHGIKQRTSDNYREYAKKHVLNS